jgi:hypothetical protein
MGLKFYSVPIFCCEIMPLKFTPVDYKALNARQQENYNYFKLSAVLAEYGFSTMRLSDDWQGADLIAQHIDGETFLKVQLKGRLTFNKKYLKKKFTLHSIANQIGIYFHTMKFWKRYLLRIRWLVLPHGRTEVDILFQL